ncbi:MAG: succinate-semialdehyde dehydrogenase/glutarate-semialdehyde dehydrogenase, partial [Polaromonas sp.]
MLDTATNLKDMLSDPALLATDAYIAGEWLEADNG